MFTNNPRIVTDGIIGAWDVLMPDTDRASGGSRSGVGKIFNSAGSTSPSTNAEMFTGRNISLDGGDEYVNCGDASDLTVTTGSFTLIGYIRNNDSGNYDVIVQKGAAGHGTTPGYRLRWESDNTLDFICTQSSSYVEDKVSSTGALSQDVWYQVAVTREAGLLKVYINGALNNSASTSVTGTLTNSAPFVLGIDYEYSSSLFNGQMADWKFFDVALSAPQIKELYVDSKVIIPYGVSQTNLKLWLPFSEGSGLICYDGSGNGNDGTFTNGDASDDWQTNNTGDAGLPQLIRGYNRPLFFKESDSIHVDWTNTQSLDDITLSAWVYPTLHNSYNPIIRLGGAFLLLNASGTSLRLVDGWATSPGSYAYTFSLNTWYHVAATRVRSGNQILYVNGSAIGTVGALSSSISMSLVEIGRRSTNYFNGLINEVAVYDGALSATEIAKLAARGPGSGSGSPLPPDAVTGVTGYNSVLGYYRNDGDLTWVDRSGHAGAGVATVYGSNLSSLLFKQGYNGKKSTSTGRDGQGFPLSRQNNGAIGFDGTTTYTDAGSVGGAGTFSNCTISVWVNPRNIVGSTTHGRIYDGNYEPSVRQRGPTLQLNGAASTSTYLFYLGADISNYFSSGNMTVPKGQWTNITMTVVTVGTASQTVVGYVNLNPEGSGSTTDSAKMWVGDIGNLRIGQGYKTGQRFFTGQIGNLQIWDRVLPLAEITQNFNAQRSRFNV